MTTSRPPLHGWIGVDLDATLAHYLGNANPPPVARWIVSRLMAVA